MTEAETCCIGNDEAAKNQNSALVIAGGPELPRLLIGKTDYTRLS
jgi:hypothetical protein